MGFVPCSGLVAASMAAAAAAAAAVPTAAAAAVDPFFVKFRPVAVYFHQSVSLVAARQVLHQPLDLGFVRMIVAARKPAQFARDVVE